MLMLVTVKIETVVSVTVRVLTVTQMLRVQTQVLKVLNGDGDRGITIVLVA